ncbi:MAG: GntR family transcriptional regulator [Ruminococcaceae bacterium]|nr:GntR family transcriptional regulator [Oscillospiraceae bacterium]
MTVKKRSNQDIVYDYVKNLIASKAIFPGNRIPDEEIIQQTGVSRSSIRPALVRLSYDGLVEIIPNRGAFVVKPDAEDMRQVFRIREVLEAGALREACKNRTGRQLQAMARNLKEQEQLLGDYTRSRYVVLNHEFHWIIAQAAQNFYYEKYLNEIFNKLNTYLIFYDNSVENNSMESHTMIYEALRDRDVDRALQGLAADLHIALDDMRKDGMDI